MLLQPHPVGTLLHAPAKHTHNPDMFQDDNCHIISISPLTLIAIKLAWIPLANCMNPTCGEKPAEGGEPQTFIDTLYVHWWSCILNVTGLWCQSLERGHICREWLKRLQTKVCWMVVYVRKTDSVLHIYSRRRLMMVQTSGAGHAFRFSWIYLPSNLKKKKEEIIIYKFHEHGYDVPMMCLQCIWIM